MKISKSSIFPLISTPLVGLLLFFGFPTLAHAGSIYVSPGAKSVGQGSTFSVSVRENSGGDEINAVQANLSYPTDKLDFLGVSGGGSSFAIDASSGGGGGGVSISRGNITGVTGDRLIGVVSFRAKTQGAATINVTGGSLVRSSDQGNVYSGGSGATITIGQGTTTQTTTATTSQKKNTLIASPSTTTPVISSISTTNLTYNTATITWTTDIPTDSQVVYGLTAQYGLSSSDKTLTKTHALSLDPKLLSPGTQYHFQVLGVGTDTETAQSPDNTFSTPGYTLQITVLTEGKKPIANAEVTIGTQPEPRKAVSNDQGVASFVNLPLGTFTVISTYQNNTQAATVQIKQQTTPQTLTLSMNQGSMSWMLLLLAIILPIISGILVYIFMKRRKTTTPIINIPSALPPQPFNQ